MPQQPVPTLSLVTAGDPPVAALTSPDASTRSAAPDALALIEQDVLRRYLALDRARTDADLDGPGRSAFASGAGDPFGSFHFPH